MARLDHYPDLSRAAAALSAERRLAVARRLAMLSAIRTGERGLGRRDEAWLEQRVTDLDTEAFDLQDRIDDGEVEATDAYAAAFHRARAVAARLYLGRRESEEAIYESLHALGPDEKLVLGELVGAANSAK